MTALPLPTPSPMPFDHPWEYELRFPRDPRGPGIARTTLRAVLAAHGLHDLTYRAELLASELATNSVRYAEHSPAVRLQWSYPVLRVSV
ncbi:ATP-binding protein [Streptomyces sp. SS8]